MLTACFTRFDRSSPMSAAPRVRAAETYAESGCASKRTAAPAHCGSWTRTPGRGADADDVPHRPAHRSSFACTACGARAVWQVHAESSAESRVTAGFLAQVPWNSKNTLRLSCAASSSDANSEPECPRERTTAARTMVGSARNAKSAPK